MEGGKQFISGRIKMSMHCTMGKKFTKHSFYFIKYEETLFLDKVIKNNVI